MQGYGTRALIRTKAEGAAALPETEWVGAYSRISRGWQDPEEIFAIGAAGFIICEVKNDKECDVRGRVEHND